MGPRVIVRPPTAAPLPWHLTAFLFIPVVLGVVLVWAGLFLQQQERDYASDGAVATGTVVGKAITSGAGDEPDRYTIAYRFTTPEGSSYSGSATTSAERYRETRIGDAVEVTYLASRPGTSRIGGAAPAAIPYLLGALGAAMSLIGAGAVVLNVIRLLRREPPRGTVIAPGETRLDITYVFRRPVSRIVVDLVGPPLGAIVFLGGAWLIGIQGVADVGLAGQLLFLAGFGFFGVALLLMVPAGLRRGFNPAVLEVGPEGMWTPEMGRLAWNEIRELRMESVLGPSGDTEDRPEPYPRLGIVPLDPAREAPLRRSLLWRMASGVSRLMPASRRGDRAFDPDGHAAFGIFAYDVGGSLDEVLAAVRRYREVAGSPVARSQLAPA